MATSAPSKAELGKAYFDFQPADGEFELFDMLGLNSTASGLDIRHRLRLPLLDLSATTFTRQETQDHTDVFAFPGAFANPAAGRFGLFVQAAAAELVPGGVGSRALIGADFSIPAGHPVITVTADVDWNYASSCWVVLGGRHAAPNSFLGSNQLLAQRINRLNPSQVLWRQRFGRQAQMVQALRFLARRSLSLVRRRKP